MPAGWSALAEAVGLQSEGCLVCGRRNPVGLGLAFEAGPEGSRATWRADERYQGFAGITHGGIVLALLDDAMWYAAYGQGGTTLTAEATVRYRSPVSSGLEVVVTGRVERHRGRLWECAAELRAAADGRLLASATGRFVAAPAAARTDLANGLPER